MKIIKTMAKQMHEEIEGAESYATLAVHYKSEHPTLAKAYYDMANDEIKHADMIHAEVVKLIDKQRAIAPPPQVMLDLWADEHAEYVDAYGKAKHMIAMFTK